MQNIDKKIEFTFNFMVFKQEFKVFNFHYNITKEN